MSHEHEIKHKYENSKCTLHIPVPVSASSGNEETEASCIDAETSAIQQKYCKNIKNCDIFWDENNFLMYADVKLFSFHSDRPFDLKDFKNLKLTFNTEESFYEVTIPLLPSSDENAQETNSENSNSQSADNNPDCTEDFVDLWKLRRITDKCLLEIGEESVKLEAKFNYGFASKFDGPPQSGESDLSLICQLPEPHITSPLQRTIDREIDEMKHFCREQYKLNFIELQVPDGYDNPMNFNINFDDVQLNQASECLLHNLTCKSEFMKLPNSYDHLEIDCCLVSILLAICYDVRFTSNESTCESGWTRSILSATLSYFEPFNSMKKVVISFLRRSLIYPLYRNYELACLCIEDAIKALQKSPQWIIKQLLLTHSLFQSDENSREPLNHYYIEDYIRYVKNEEIFTTSHRQTIARDLKSAVLNVVKKDLRLNLCEIEAELMQEIMEEMQMENSTEEGSEKEVCIVKDTEGNDDDDEDDDEDDETIEDDDDDETDSSSETEENSVIEQRIANLNI